MGYIVLVWGTVVIYIYICQQFSCLMWESSLDGGHVEQHGEAPRCDVANRGNFFFFS